jgi:hypothetical protein
MTEQIPSLGRNVHYVLSATDVAQINRRRTNGSSIAARMKEVPPAWPAGAQAHIGNDVHEGDVYPMMVTRVWGPYADSLVNGQVFLDSNDVFWATSVKVGNSPGTFHWPTWNTRVNRVRCWPTSTGTTTNEPSVYAA